MRLKSAAIRSSVLAAAILGFAVPARLQAQFGIAARVSTLGIGGEVSYRVSRILGVRGGINYFSLTKNATVQGIDYTITPHLENETLIADLYPLGGSFHLSGGLLFNSNEGRMVARLTQNVQIGDSTYTPSQVGSLRGTISFNKSAPYLGLGFAGRGRVSFLFDLGVGFTGTPKADLVGTTSLTGQAKTQFDANIVKEQTQVRSDISDKSYLKYHPVLSLGLKVGL